MKQAQAMQDNLKRHGRTELAPINPAPGLVKIVKKARCQSASPSTNRRRQGHAGRPGGGSLQRRRAQGRGNFRKMGKLTAGMPGLPGGMKFPFCRKRVADAMPLDTDPGTAAFARRGGEVGPAHGFSFAAARPPGALALRKPYTRRCRACATANAAIPSPRPPFAPPARMRSAMPAKLWRKETPADQGR